MKENLKRILFFYIKMADGKMKKESSRTKKYMVDVPMKCLLETLDTFF